MGKHNSVNDRLEIFNNEVESLLKKRKDYLDKKAIELSKVKIGEDLYDLKTFKKLGKVSEIYCYSETCFDISYQYETSKNCFDNTSNKCLTEYNLGTKKQMIERMEESIQYLKQTNKGELSEKQT
jgi:hypothetical protein